MFFKKTKMKLQEICIKCVYSYEIKIKHSRTHIIENLKKHASLQESLEK